MVLLPGDVQSVEILLSDVEVGANVNDVDALHGVRVLKLLDGPRDDATSHHRLAQPGLVGYEEALAVALSVELPYDVLNRVALEVCESA